MYPRSQARAEIQRSKADAEELRLQNSGLKAHVTEVMAQRDEVRGAAGSGLQRQRSVAAAAGGGFPDEGADVPAAARHGLVWAFPAGCSPLSNTPGCLLSCDTGILNTLTFPGCRHRV